MAANIKNALNAYGQSSVEIDVEHASPHKLICMLYEGAIKALFMAKLHMQNKEIGPKGVAISKAIAIIEEGLRNSLDAAEQSSEIAASLDAVKACLKTVENGNWTMRREQRATTAKRGKPTVSDPTGLF